jgi:hypothetical protein
LKGNPYSFTNQTIGNSKTIFYVYSKLETCREELY